MTRTGQVRSSSDTTFVNNFWGQNEAGFQSIQTRIKHAVSTMQELLAYYLERIAIEKDYNKKLDRLNHKVVLGANETGSLKKALDKFAYENDQMCAHNAKFYNLVSQGNYDRLQHFFTVYTKNVTKIENHMHKVAGRRSDARRQVDAQQLKYREECSQVKALTLLCHTTWGKELERNQAKLAKIQSSVDSALRNYQQALSKYRDSHELWMRDWSVSLQNFYQLELERIQVCKINCFNFCNSVATLCVDHDQAVDLSRLLFAQVSPPRDLKDYGDTYGTGDRIYDPPKYVDYMNGHDDLAEATGGYKQADFEMPDDSPVLARAYSVASAGTNSKLPLPQHKPVSPKPAPLSPTHAPLLAYTTPSKGLPPPLESNRVSLPPPSSGKPINQTPSPIRKQPTNGSNYSAYASGKDENDVFSVKETKALNASNGSSNYSNPTNYTSSNYSSSSNGERHWASPRRTEKQLHQFQEQINLKSKELPKYPLDKSTTLEAPQNVPISKDFSVDFIAKALEDLNAGGNGDISQFRRSVRRAQREQQEQQSPTRAPVNDQPFKPASDYVDDSLETATRYGSIRFKSPGQSQRAHSGTFGSPPRQKARPRSMFEPASTSFTQEDLVIVKKTPSSNGSAGIGGRPERSLLKTPSKSYTNLNSLMQQNHGNVTPVTKNPYVTKARAKYTYNPQHHGELYFKKGWQLYVIHKQEDNWFVCELGRNCADRVGMVGLVPGNYIVEGPDLF